MNKDCETIRQLFDGFLFNEINEEVKAMFKKHLRECKICRSEFEKEEDLHRTIEERRRNEPGTEFWDNYWNKLNKRMVDEALLPQKTREFRLPRWLVQGIAACILIVVGMFIGKLVFLPSDPYLKSNLHISSGSKAMNLELVKNTRNYINKSRIMLLAVINFDPETEDASVLNLTHQQKLSRELVNQASYIKAELKESGQRKLLDLIEDLEVILLQIANLDGKPDITALEMISRGIESRGILFQIRMSDFRKSLNAEKSRNI